MDFSVIFVFKQKLQKYTKGQYRKSPKIIQNYQPSANREKSKAVRSKYTFVKKLEAPKPQTSLASN